MKCILSATGKQLLDEIHADSAGYTQHPGLWLGRSSGPVSTGRHQKVMSRVSPEARSLPILIKAAGFTITATTNHTRNMVICVVGTGHDWTLQESSGRIHSRAGCH
jgi:hypothetical protein